MSPKWLRRCDIPVALCLADKNVHPPGSIEVKAARCVLSPPLFHFQKQTGAKHAFQAVLDLPHEAIDCFAHRQPVIVPLRTLLSQLP